MKRLDDFMGYDSHLLLCLNAPDLSADYIIRNMQVCASQLSKYDTVCPVLLHSSSYSDINRFY